MWCLDASTQEVMTDPVTLAVCGHSIDREELKRVFTEESYGSTLKYRCPVPTCQRLIRNRPGESPTAAALKLAIEAEQKERQRKFDEKLQKAYDAIKLDVDDAFNAVTGALERV